MNMIERYDEFVGKEMLFLENYDEFAVRKKIKRNKKKMLKQKQNGSDEQQQKLEMERIEQIKKAMSQYSAGFSTAFK